MSNYFITDRAAADLAGIWDDVTDYSSERNAQKLFTSLWLSFQNVADFPDIGLKRDYLPKGVLAFAHKPYMIFYTKSPRNIDILQVIHGARDLPAYLMICLKPKFF